MMKYKRLVYSFILVIIFSFLWLHLNRNYLSSLDELGIQGMIYLTSAYAGYNSIMSHASMYTIFFLLLLILSMPQNSIQILIRKKRIEFVLIGYKRILCAALQFSGIFMSVLVIFTAIFEKKQMLFETGFWSGAAILIILLALYYFFIGTIFCFFRLVMLSNTKSFVCTFIVSVLLLYFSRFKHLWTPVSSIDIFDLLFENELYLEEAALNSLKIAFLIIALFYITYVMFKEKDVLHEKY